MFTVFFQLTFFLAYLMNVLLLSLRVFEQEKEESEDKAGQPSQHVGHPPALTQNVESSDVNTSHLPHNTLLLAL